MSTSWQHLYVVYRFDRGRWKGVAPASINDAITIKEILATEEEAVAEVERLRELNSHKGWEYFFQSAKFYPDGRA